MLPNFEKLFHFSQKFLRRFFPKLLRQFFRKVSLLYENFLKLKSHEFSSEILKPKKVMENQNMKISTLSTFNLSQIF